MRSKKGTGLGPQAFFDPLRQKAIRQSFRKADDLLAERAIALSGARRRTHDRPTGFPGEEGGEGEDGQNDLERCAHRWNRCVRSARPAQEPDREDRKPRCSYFRARALATVLAAGQLGSRRGGALPERMPELR